MNPTTLERSIGLPLLTLYGLGTILGAGIYVLIGHVAATAGSAAPSSFVLAAVLAGTTALSFAELSARVPRSAGEAAYVEAAFGRPWLTRTVGWSVILVGIVSAATMVRGFVGYLAVFVSLPSWLVIVLVVSMLGAIAAWGIGESLRTAAAITVLEVLGLLYVCFVARDSLLRLPGEWTTLLPAPTTPGLIGAVSGAFIAFYAFIGFEDMVNIAEEVKVPTHNLPRGILIALLTSTMLYFLVATVAVLAVPLTELAGSEAPLAVIVQSRGFPPETIAGISLFAVTNGALIQIIMTSRVLYGLAQARQAWTPFAYLHPRTRTPLVGTALVTCMLMALALFFTLGGLARATSFIALSIFACVNAALWRLKRRGTRNDGFSVPIGVPAAGFTLCVTMIVYEAVSSF
jgi:amino acid transporter